MYIHMYRHGRSSRHVRGADFADVSIEKGGRDDQRGTHDEIGRHDKVKEVHLHTQTDVCMYVYAYSCVTCACICRGRTMDGYSGVHNH